MLVCHCKLVRCSDIREAVHEGAQTTEDIARMCGAGTGCGGCRPLVRNLVEREKRTLSVVTHDDAA